MEVQSVAQDEEGAKKSQVEEAKLIHLVGFCRLMLGRAEGAGNMEEKCCSFAYTDHMT